MTKSPFFSNDTKKLMYAIRNVLLFLYSLQPEITKPKSLSVPNDISQFFKKCLNLFKIGMMGELKTYLFPKGVKLQKSLETT